MSASGVIEASPDQSRAVRPLTDESDRWLDALPDVPRDKDAARVARGFATNAPDAEQMPTSGSRV